LRRKKNTPANDATVPFRAKIRLRLYALSGRQGEALAQYERLGEVLSARLGAEPPEETRRLREDIATGRFPRGLAAGTSLTWPLPVPG